MIKAIGYVVIGVAIFLYYEGFRGRTMTEAQEDMSALIKGVITFDSDAIIGAVSEAGTLTDSSGTTTENSLSRTDRVVGDSADYAGSSGKGTRVLKRAKELGEAATGYRLGGTGPKYYDCSGLIWRAMNDLNLAGPVRFTTFTFKAQTGSKIEQVDSPSTGDIILWELGHMGICDGPNSIYHASSPKSGILTSNLTTLTNYIARNKTYGPVTYWRLV